MGIDACPDGGTVSVSNGTYTGASNKNLSWSGKHIAVKSINGHSNCIIDCQNSGRGFYFNSTGQNSTDIIQGFTIRNGYVTGSWPANCGGGIYCYISSPSIIYSDFWGNNPNDDWSGGLGNISLNPQFIGEGNYHLKPTSPCIDSGSNSPVSVSTDLDGNQRKVDGNSDGTATIDMGAYEYQGAWIFISPQSGQVGTIVIVEGENFATQTQVSISFGTHQTITTITSSVNSTFSATFIVPEQPSGTKVITAIDSEGNLATYAFILLPPTFLKIVPSSNLIAKNQEFDVDVKIEDVRDMAAAETLLAFDPSILEVLSITNGSFPSGAGIVKNYNNTTGSIYYFAGLFTGSATGSDVLCSITFRVKAEGESIIKFDFDEEANRKTLFIEKNNVVPEIIGDEAKIEVIPSVSILLQKRKCCRLKKL
ncbi:MAG: cohesin domain-containing protein [Candidatus Desantisbacteria bacterium]